MNRTERKTSDRLVALVLGGLVVAALTATTALATQWDYPLTATNGAGTSQIITVGIDPAGTPGIDSALGEVELPPWPPTSIFDVRFHVETTEGVRSEIRNDQPEVRTHEIRWQAGSGGYPITLRWDPSAMPAATFTLEDGYTGQFIPPVNMSQVDSLVVPIEMSFIQRLKLTVLPGSIPPSAPVIAPIIPDVAVFEGNNIPEFILDDFVSDADHGDANLTWLALGSGPPWLLITPDRRLQVDAPAGWTGTTHYTLRVEDPDGLYDEQPFSVTIQPDGSPAWSVPLTVENAVFVSDGAEFGIDPAATPQVDTALGEVALPPWPPSDVLDARFLLPDGLTHVDQDLRQTRSDTINWTLEWHPGSGGYPITVSWPANLPAGTFWLQDGYGGSLIPALDMSATTSLTIPTNLDVVKRLQISAVPVLSNPGVDLTHYHVKLTGSNGNPGTEAEPFATITYAALVADVGDTITIHPGQYMESEIPLPDGVQVRGFNFDPASVVINANGNGAGFVGSNLQPGTKLVNVSVINASAGAVVFDNSSVEIIGCIFQDNTNPDNGGAIRSTNSSLFLAASTFTNNASGGSGGALFATGSGCAALGCFFTSNQAGAAGGAIMMSTTHTADVEVCTFTGNESLGGPGGAVRYSSYEAEEFRVWNSEFRSNTSYSGAAAISSFTEVLEGQPFGVTSVSTSTFVGNVGGSVIANLQYHTYIYGCTFASNEVSEVLSMDGSASNITADISNCLIAFNQGTAVGGVIDSFYSNDVFGNMSGDYVGPLFGLNDGIYNFSADPLLCDLNNGDVTLASSSPCLIGNSPLETPANVGNELEGCSNPSAVPEDLQPVVHQLEAAFPNPFNPSTTIAFSLPNTELVSLQVFDLSGRLVRTLVAAETLGAGTHHRSWDGLSEQGRAVSSGVYLYRLQAGTFVEARRMMLLK